MIFSLSTIINTFIISSIFIILLFFLVTICPSSSQLNLRTIFFLCFALMLRLFLPIEFPFTYSIRIKNLWGKLHSILYTECFHIDNFNGITFINILFSIWIICSVYRLIHFIYAYQNATHSINNLPQSQDACILHALSISNSKFKHPIPVKLFIDKYTSSPYIIGIKTPMIVIPDTELAEKEWNYIFSHELSHFYKGHLLSIFLLEILTALYFWNPFLLILKKQFYRLLEFSADEKTILPLSPLERISYADCLIKMMHLQKTKITISVHGISFGTSSFSARIKRILQTKDISKSGNINRGLVTGIFILFILSYSVILEPFYEPSDQNTFTLDTSNSYYFPNKNGTYDVFCNGEYVITVDHIFDEQIPIKEEPLL